jgi:hypothetical protein
MIESVKSFKTSDSKTFLNREEAQLHEIELLLEDKVVAEVFARNVMEHKDALLAILSTRKPRTAKAKSVKGKKVEAIA